MTTLTERLEFFLEANPAGAIKGFVAAGEAAEVNLKKAETSGEKLSGNLTKTGAGAVAFAGIAGAALMETATSFEHLALEAGKMATTTGMTTQESSRWIEVAKQMGISGGDVESAMIKMNKAIATSPQHWTSLSRCGWGDCPARHGSSCR